jgi:hypothetical protein
MIVSVVDLDGPTDLKPRLHSSSLSVVGLSLRICSADHPTSNL